MIVGNGLLARALYEYDNHDVLFFASGVSNSLETKEEEFQREMELLMRYMKDYSEKKIVYFSTCSIYDPTKQNSPYVLHKKNIENYIQKESKNFLIYRVGNVIGKGGNENTLFNFLVRHIQQNKNFQVYKNARRVIIDIDDLSSYVGSSVKFLNNKIQNIAYPYQFSMNEIMSQIEDFFQIKSQYEELNKGDAYELTFDEDIFSFFYPLDSRDYIKKIIAKYAK